MPELTLYDGDRLVARVAGEDGVIPYDGWAGEPAAVRALYAELADGWAARGIGRHVVYAPPPGEPFLPLGFGIEQLYASRDLTPLPRPAGVEVRIAGEDDLDSILALSEVIGRYQRRSPVFADVPDSFFEQLPQSHAETLREEGSVYLLAHIDGALAGMALVQSAEPGPMTPPGCASLAVMATFEEFRGRGAGLALTAACFDVMREAGYSDASRTGARRTRCRRASGRGGASSRSRYGWPGSSRLTC